MSRKTRTQKYFKQETECDCAEATTAEVTSEKALRASFDLATRRPVVTLVREGGGGSHAVSAEAEREGAHNSSENVGCEHRVEGGLSFSKRGRTTACLSGLGRNLQGGKGWRERRGRRGDSLRKKKRFNPQVWLHNFLGGGGASQDLYWTLGAQNSCPLSPQPG